MKRFLISLVGLGFILTLLNGCGAVKPPAPEPPVVYTAGCFTYNRNNMYNEDTFCYWEGTTEKNDLFTSSEGWVTDLWVENGQVSVAGNELSYPPNAFLWTGGTLKDLPSPSSLSTIVRKICKIEGKMYAVGSDNSIPCYWEGDQVKLIEKNGQKGEAVDICSNNGKKYILLSYESENGGSSTRNYYYWQDGNLVELNKDAQLLLAFCICKNSIYTAGHSKDGDKLCYWKNATEDELPMLEGCNKADVNAAFSDGNKVYLAGNCDKGLISYPCYWEITPGQDEDDKKVIPLPYKAGNQAGGTVWDIFVLNGVVYTSGSCFDPDKKWNNPCYWEGTTLKIISSDYSGCANAIYVVNKK